MCEVIVLFEGYSTQIDDLTMDANGTCTLIKAPNKNIIVDTMTAWDRDEILMALARNGLQPKDINFVVCSHSHADHIGNNNLFLEAEQHIVGNTVHHDTLFHEKNIKTRDYQLCEGVKVMSTPGHTAECVSVIVNGKFNGEDYNIAITGDLFEREDDLTDPTIWMNLGAPDLREVQATSRCKIASLVDIIIPGHGPAFNVTDKVKDQLSKQLDDIKPKNQ